MLYLYILFFKSIYWMPSKCITSSIKMRQFALRCQNLIYICFLPFHLVHLFLFCGYYLNIFQLSFPLHEDLTRIFSAIWYLYLFRYFRWINKFYVIWAIAKSSAEYYINSIWMFSFSNIFEPIRMKWVALIHINLCMKRYEINFLLTLEWIF